MDRLTLSVSEAARALGVSRNLAYELVRSGRLPSIKLGAKRIVISKTALDRFLAQPNSN